MKLLFPKAALARSEVFVLLAERGFTPVADEPITNGTKWTTWQKAEDAIAYVTRGAAGTATFKIAGPNAADLAADLAQRVPSQTDRELCESAAAGSVRVRVRRAFELGTIFWLESDVASDAKRALFALLGDDEPIVRWAATRALPKVDAEIVEAVGRAAERHSDLRGVHARLRAANIAQEEGTLNDGDTDDRFELLRRAREGANDGKWRRVARAMDALLAESPWDDEGLHLRGLAHEAEGETLEALFLLGAAEQALKSSEQVRRRVDADEAEADDDDDDDQQGDAGDEDASNETIEAVRAKLLVLRERALTSTEEERARARGFALRWLGSWEETVQVAQVYGAAKALRGRLPELEALCGFLQGRYEKDEALLEQALELAPDSPSIALALAHLVVERDEAAGLARFAALRERLRTASELSPAAQAVEDVAAARGEKHGASEASVVAVLAERAYEASDYDSAAALADELCALDPDTGVGWQLRANSRIFALRHEEAVVAYDEALAALDRIYDDGKREGSIFFGDDARPGMFFNRGCAQAKLGRKADALESLRAAIRGNEKYAAEAVADDYLESLFEDPEFRAIVAQEPKALRTADERNPVWVKALVARARDEQQSGDAGTALTTAERAAELAGWLDAPALLVESLAVLGRMQAFNGSLEQGLETATRAVELSESAAVPAEIGALAHAQRGICLQAADRLEEAEAAYQAAFDARRAAFGESHPLLVKSLVSVAGVALARGREPASVEGLLARGIDIAHAYLAGSPAHDHIWAELLDDLVSLLIRRAILRTSQTAGSEAVQALALAVDRLAEQRAAGYVPMAPVLEQIRAMARDLASAAATPEQAAAAHALRLRAEEVLIPGAGRRLRLVFHDVRTLVGQLRASGVEDPRIAAILADFVRGGDALPAELRNVSVLAELRTILADAAARESTVLVTAAMALSIAAMPGELDQALKQLEELIVGVLDAD